MLLEPLLWYKDPFMLAFNYGEDREMTLPQPH